MQLVWHKGSVSLKEEFQANHTLLQGKTTLNLQA